MNKPTMEALLEGRAKYREMIETMSRVQGAVYAQTVHDAVQVVNLLIMLRGCLNNGELSAGPAQLMELPMVAAERGCKSMMATTVALLEPDQDKQLALAHSMNTDIEVILGLAHKVAKRSKGA
jgi:hypothetical protein